MNIFKSSTIFTIHAKEATLYPSAPKNAKCLDYSSLQIWR